MDRVYFNSRTCWFHWKRAALPRGLPPPIIHAIFPPSIRTREGNFFELKEKTGLSFVAGRAGLSIFVFQRLIEPCFCQLPLTPDGFFADAEKPGDFVVGEADEEAQLDDVGLLGILER